jgi:hypothetical protein
MIDQETERSSTPWLGRMLCRSGRSTVLRGKAQAAKAERGHARSESVKSEIGTEGVGEKRRDFFERPS